MTLVQTELPPFIVDENAHVPAKDGKNKWLVIATREALDLIDCPRDASSTELEGFLPTLIAVANHKLELGRTAEESTIWIHVDDIRDWNQIGRR
jgi:hypothetical protein